MKNEHPEHSEHNKIVKEMGDVTQSERRTGKKSWVTTAVTLTSFFGWFGVLAWIAMLDRASPRSKGFLDVLSGNVAYSKWNGEMLRSGLIVLILVVVLCLLGLFFDISHKRRKEDKVSRPLIILSAVSVVGLLAYAIFFWNLM